jgi:hypothetical protein
MSKFPDVFEDPWFRCVSVVGAAVRDRRREIFDATRIDQRETWLYAIDLIEDECRSARSKGIIQDDPDYLVKRVSDQLAATSKTFAEQPALADVLQDIAAAIRPLKSKQIMAVFDAVNHTAFDITKQCISQWGGTHAGARLGNFGLADLTFEECDSPGPKTIVPTWTETEDDELSIHVAMGGGQKPLLGALCLEFYFFHEYLSHVFPVHEDTAGSLSEGYLFKIARWWYLQSENVPMTSALVEVDWANHWERQQIKPSADFWNLLHQQTEWFEVNSSRRRLAWIILEVAAFAEDQKYRFQARFLGFLQMLYRVYDRALGSQLLSGQTKIEDVHDELQKALEPKVNREALAKVRGRRD